MVPWGGGTDNRISYFIKDALELLLTPFTTEMLYAWGCEGKANPAPWCWVLSLQNWEINHYCFIVGSPNSLLPWMQHRAPIFSSWGLRGLLEFAFAKSWPSWAFLDAFPSGHVEFSDTEGNGVPKSSREDANNCGAAIAFPSHPAAVVGGPGCLHLLQVFSWPGFQVGLRGILP